MIDIRVIDDPDAPAMRLDLDEIERKARASKRKAFGQRVMVAADDVLALIARIRELEAGESFAQKADEHKSRVIDELGKLEAIAEAAVAFVDEQGRFINSRGEISAADEFASDQWPALVAAVEGAGR